MEERDFFDETQTVKPASLNCDKCHQVETYDVRWVVRTKKKTVRGGADERDRARFAKARSYMTRVDNFMQCKNPRCRKRFEISGLQSVVYLYEDGPNEPRRPPSEPTRGNNLLR